MNDDRDAITFEFHVGRPEYFPETELLSRWLKEIAAGEKALIEQMAYTFVSDDELLEMNKQFLQHDTLTDILTFPYSYQPIRADIFISLDRVKENAATHNQETADELCRVIAHGLLHMCGLNDVSVEEKKEMRRREDFWLNLR